MCGPCCKICNSRTVIGVLGIRVLDKRHKSIRCIREEHATSRDRFAEFRR